MPNYDLVYRQMQQLKKEMAMIIQSMHLQLSGEAVKSQALEKILLDKGIFTQDELKKKMAEVIAELNSTANDKQEESEKKPELIQPSQEDVANVEKSKDDEQKK